jgi:transcriptional regulator with XRE-family HTH domain
MVRENLKLTQSKFANKLSLERSTVSLIERHRRNVTERTIKDICREFNVNEKWLRTGEGTMFNEIPPDDELSQYLGELLKPDDKNEFIKKIVLTYMRLDDNGKKIIRDFAESLGSKKK